MDLKMAKWKLRHINITPEQDAWLKRKCINLSLFVRKKIDEEMKKEGEKKA